VLRFAFEQLALHRMEVNIVPRNRASRRVAEKLGLREEGVSRAYLQIRGRWEDHVRYAMTADEWAERKAELTGAFLGASRASGVSG
jgi:ribosomal-protein-alanine N-acetyltransferase